MSTYLPTVFGENLMDVFDDFDRNFFRGFGNADRALYGKHAQNMMKTDVKETEEGYEVDIDLPGFKKDEIHLELNDGYLTISTEKSLEKDDKNKKGRMLRQERYAVWFCLSLHVETAMQTLLLNLPLLPPPRLLPKLLPKLLQKLLQRLLKLLLMRNPKVL